jgi:hypothetical protein
MYCRDQIQYISESISPHERVGLTPIHIIILIRINMVNNNIIKLPYLIKEQAAE